MSMTFFKPNKMNQGALISIKFLAKQSKKDEDFKEGCFFLNLVRQVSWNDQKHTGSFSGGESIGVKLSQFEVAKILHVIERNWNLGDISKMDRDALQDQYGFKGTHSGQGQTTYINFVPWQRKGAPEQTGFGLFITKVADGKENSKFGVSFPFGDDIALREYIKLGLEHINMASYAEDKRRFEESMANKQDGNGGARNSAPDDSEPPAPAPSRGRGRGPAKPKAIEEPSEPESIADDDSDEPLF